MDNYEKCIKKYAVRLNDSIESGTGFLFTRQGSDYVYIFTVLHVVISTLTKVGKNNLTVDWNESHFVCRGVEIEYCTLYHELDMECLMSKTEEHIKQIINNIEDKVMNRQNQERNKDIVVLRIQKSNFMDNSSVSEEELYCIDEEKLQDNFQFIGFGFPNEKMFALRLDGKNIRWNKENGLRDCQAIGMDQDFVNQMRGFSGTGLVTEYLGRLILIGFVVSCNMDEKNQCFRVVGTSEILSRMKQKGWEIPNIFGEGMPPENFLDKVFYFKDDLENMYSEVKSGLTSIFMEIEKENKPSKLAKTEVFYDIPKCVSERISCPIYWKGRYWMSYIYKTVHDLISDDSCIKINGQQLKIEYICTEGNGEANISTVVASAIKKNILGYQIKGNSILFWQSAKNPNRGIFQKRKFKNIVKNIADGTLCGVNGKPVKAGYDLLTGEMQTKDYGIFHIKYLLEQLEKCQVMNEANNKVKEVLEDVWK